MNLRVPTPLGLLAAATVAGATVLTAGVAGPASAAPSATAAQPCGRTASTVEPGVQIVDPGCGFAAYAGSSISTGILDGSAYRIEVPADWNGQLVMYAHGYAGTGTTVSVGNPALRRWFVDHGYAWAASSYRKNGYNVGDGVRDTQDLKEHFAAITGRSEPTRSFLTGASMGGHITAVSLETYRGEYAGAMPYCGVLGGNRLFDYFAGANLTAAALTDTQVRFPTTAAEGAAYVPEYSQAVKSLLPELGITGTGPITTHFTDTGRQWSDAVQQLSGGTRPGFREALKYYWNSFGYAPLTDVPFLFGLYPGLTGGTTGYADGNLVDNTDTTYQLDRDPAVSPAERELNDEVLRVDATATTSTDPAQTELPEVEGDPQVPVLSLHDIDDLFVPFSMEQIYAQQAADNGQADLFVSRAIRGVGHCEFTLNELSAGFRDLVSWVDSGTKPAGDDVLDPVAVRNGTFGCRFTDPDATKHTFFGPVPCPKG